MILLVALIIFVIGCCLSTYDDINYDNQRRAEKRHQELLRELEESRKERKIVPPSCGSNVVPKQARRTRRRVAKDKNGNILSEEILEEIING